MKKVIEKVLVAILFATSTLAFSQTEKPTIVLVHGAFADTSSWNKVTRILEDDGYRVVAVANPLRSVKADADYTARIIASINSSVVLVGHSYGGSVISEAAFGRPNVKALVFVSAFSPDVGESASSLSGKFPGSTLGPTLSSGVTLANGDKDLYIEQDKFRAQFAADVPAYNAKLMAAAQRPITEAALKEPAITAAWKTIPSWFVYGDKDKNIPSQLSSFMAKRARAKDVIEVPGASHVVMISHAKTVATLIERAARAQ